MEPTPPAAPLRTERADGVMTLTIDDADTRNALTDAVLAELVARMTEADATDEIRAVVLEGSDAVFASGADIRALLDRDALGIYGGDRARLWAALRRTRTPTVAAVSGLCLGGGCELAMMSDVVVASETARFGLPETQLGLIPGAGGTQMLPRAIGKAKAMDMVLTGRLLDAAEAERAGLVSRVAAPDAWRALAGKVARRIASRPAVAERLGKEAVLAAFETPLQAGIDGERRAFAMTFASSDAREGLTAFVEKRDPSWSHR
ncbi:enoyl-CoA hydratase-related protein [Patulibacter sp.]|uniref:enoyl-CoA hydratase-related protein n=1 Tax=Patulibacter sp. TaxID=1912859 RepID=UPI002726DF2B|nr:enoyl-CoA hydratase-related protein [Patulibacter sp.]MDO9408879.1 enoyl-CoA hydratase-related protein [Patulibacter sp.]